MRAACSVTPAPAPSRMVSLKPGQVPCFAVLFLFSPLRSLLGQHDCIGGIKLFASFSAGIHKCVGALPRDGADAPTAESAVELVQHQGQ